LLQKNHAWNCPLNELGVKGKIKTFFLQNNKLERLSVANIIGSLLIFSYEAGADPSGATTRSSSWPKPQILD
jgi:hypothetical protein